MVKSRMRGVLSHAVGALVALIAVSSAPGQMWGMSEEQMLAPIEPHEVELMARDLGLSEDIRRATEDLYAGVRLQFNDLIEELESMFQSVEEEMEETGDMSALTDAMGRLQGFQDRADALRDRYYDDVKLLLDDGQLARWDRFHKRARRERVVGQMAAVGFVAGTGVNITGILDEVELTPESEEAVDVILMQYETEFAALLDEIEEFEIRQFEETAEIMAEMKDASDWMTKMHLWEDLFTDGMKLNIRARDANLGYAERIEAALPEDQRLAFRDRVNEAAHPRIYKGTRVDEAFEVIDGIEDLDAGQQERLAALRVEYDREVRKANGYWASAVRSYEPEMSMMDLFTQQGNESVNLLREKRNKLVSSYDEKVRAVLTPEQQALLPVDAASDWRNLAR